MKDIECPYCGNEQDVCIDDGFGCEESICYEEQCEKCDKYFALYVSWSPYYTSHKADCMNGKDHNYKPIVTLPKAFTKMRCKWCEKEREPTKEEKVKYDIPSKESYMESLKRLKEK